MPLQLTLRTSGDSPTRYLHAAPDQIDCRARCRRPGQPPERARSASRADSETTQPSPSAQCGRIVGQPERSRYGDAAAGKKKEPKRPMSSRPVMDSDVSAFASNVHDLCNPCGCVPLTTASLFHRATKSRTPAPASAGLSSPCRADPIRIRASWHWPSACRPAPSPSIIRRRRRRLLPG
jgi:hypothetical protein